jgi:hypothetical protein
MKLQTLARGAKLVAPLLRGNPWRRAERTAVRDAVEVVQHIREGRFQRSLSLITAFAALLGGMEVTSEHYRGSYSQRVMYSPVFLSPPLVVAGVWGAWDRRVARTLLPLASAAMLVDGVIGFGFHIRGIKRKPGGWRLPVTNITMGPPLFAPLLLGLSGFLGVTASMLRREDDPPREKLQGARGRRPGWLGLVPRQVRREGLILEQDVREGRFQRALALATAISALLNGGEALYSHYQDRFRQRVQWSPIILSPLIAAAGFGAVASKRVARTWLPLLSAAALANGGIGFGFHVRGAMRHPGNVHQPLHTLMYGPPLFAPLLFAATGFLGVLASLLRRAK